MFLSIVSVAFAVTQLEASNALDQAKTARQEALATGLGTQFINDTLILAQYDFDNQNYARSAERSKTIIDRKDAMFRLSDALKALELRVNRTRDSGLEVTSAFQLYLKATGAFQNETLDETETLIEKANAELDKIKSEAIIAQTLLESSKRNIIAFVQDNWQALSITGTILLVAVMLAYGQIRVELAKRKLAEIEIEKRVLSELSKNAQKQNYQDKTISESAYNTMMENYKDRNIKINEETPALKLMVAQGPTSVFRIFIPKLGKQQAQNQQQTDKTAKK